MVILRVPHFSRGLACACAPPGNNEGRLPVSERLWGNILREGGSHLSLFITENTPRTMASRSQGHKLRGIIIVINVSRQERCPLRSYSLWGCLHILTRVRGRCQSSREDSFAIVIHFRGRSGSGGDLAPRMLPFSSSLTACFWLGA